MCHSTCGRPTQNPTRSILASRGSPSLRCIRPNRSCSKWQLSRNHSLLLNRSRWHRQSSFGRQFSLLSRRHRKLPRRHNRCKLLPRRHKQPRRSGRINRNLHSNISWVITN